MHQVCQVCIGGQGNNEAKLWNLRYIHLHEKGLKLLSHKNMVLRLPEIGALAFCEGWVYKNCFQQTSLQGPLVV